MLTWKINGATLDTLNISIAGGSFRTHGASVLQLRRNTPFDTAEITGLQYGDAVEVTYYDPDAEVPADELYFQGTVASIPKFGTDSEEGHEILVEDAWAQLEATIYQEAWAYGSTTYPVPKAVFGMAPDGTRITVGAQISAVIAYAATAGIAIAAGSIPTGEIPLPAEVSNVSCAEMINMCLRFHPDWMPWIDHTTTPPTFHVTPAASATPLTYTVNGTGAVQSFSVTKRDDLLPESVRIFYDYATSTDVEGEPEIFRSGTIDKWPTDGPDSGPKVISAVVPLAGMQMQVQKTRIHTATIPTSQETAKAWLKKKYLHLAGVDDSHFTVTEWERNLIPDDEDHADPLNERAVRLAVSTVANLPRELLHGTIEDWMRVRVGRIEIKPKIEPTASATEATTIEILKGTPAVTIVATNATTKIYKGLTQWEAAENVPTGIAQAVYEAIHNSSAWQGSVTLTQEDIPMGRIIGKKLHFSGGLTAWETMGAPIHALAFDLDAGSITIDFGPNPALAPQDFLELQRILRHLPVKWWSAEERESNKHGAQDAPSAAGDTVTPYDIPQTNFGPHKGLQMNVHVRTQTEGTDGNEWVIDNTQIRTVCFRNGVFVGSFMQADPDATPTEILTSFESIAPAGLVSFTVSDIEPIS